MTEPTADEIITLADRLDDERRAVSEEDLVRVTGFLYETLGRWYQLTSEGEPPSVELDDVLVTARPSAQGASGSTLLDPGDTMDVRPGATVESGESSTVDERNGVFAASEHLAQVALGRRRADDETWDDVIQSLENEQRSALASALWVGLATEPEVRYPTIGHWRRAVDTALRSDAATARMFEDEARNRRGPLVAAAAALAIAVVGVGAFLALTRGDTTASDAGPITTEPEAPTATDEESGDDSTSTTDPDESGDGGDDDEADEGGEEATATGDECSLVGPLGPISVDQVSDGAIVVSWVPTTEAVNILLDGAFIDTVPSEAFRYVVEQLPLTAGPLVPDTDYTVGVEPQSGEASTACATTLANPIPASESLVGVTAPTGLVVLDTSSTSITVGWDPRPGADQHNLYLDGAYLQLGSVGGSSSIGDETEFTFLDLEPDTTYEIGVRRIEAPNQSGVVTITAATDSP